MTAIPTRADQEEAAGAARARARGAERLLRAHPADPAWARPAVAVLLLATALLYMVGLDRNGWGNEFYAAAVQAGTRSWRAFFFGSLDAGNFITTDKPAPFMWVMELSARVFGFNYWSLLLPQAVAGVATAGVLYTTVRRWFGPRAGLLAAAVTALAPVAALMFRFDDPDALLTLAITLAAYAMTRAVESGRTRWLVLTGVFVGAGFLSKFMAAFMVLPALTLVYLWAGPPRLGKRVWQLLAGGLAVVVSSGWWVAAVLLTPAADRPFVGNSTNNNILNLILVYNGFGRLTGNEGRGGGLTGPASGAAGRGFGGFGDSGGITRLFSAQYGGMVGWLIPAALIAIVVMLWVTRRAARTDRTRAAALLWGGWLLGAGLVLSFMSGISHSYYVVALTPAIGALVGIGAVKLWEIRTTWFARGALAAALLVTGGWAWILLGRSPQWFGWLRVVIVLAAIGAACLVVAGCGLRGRPLLTALPVSLALVAGLGGPLAYSIETAGTVHTGASPTAGPALTAAGGVAGRGAFPGAGAGFARGAASGAGDPASGAGTRAGGFGNQAGGFGNRAGGDFGDRADRRPGVGAAGGLGGLAGGNGGTNATTLTKLLEDGAAGYKWVAATVGSDQAASMELSTGGDPVMAIGGFSGTDPTPSLTAFEQLVAKHEVHYFIESGAGGGGRAGFGAVGGTEDSAQVTAWVEAHFTAKTVGGTTVYDLTAPASGS